MNFVFSFLILAFFQITSLHAEEKPCTIVYNHLKQDNVKKAHELTEQGKCPDLKIYVKWQYLRFDKNEATFRNHYDFLQEHKDWPFLHQIRNNMERREPADIDNAELLKWFSKNPPSTRGGVSTHVQLLRKNSQELKADKLIGQFWSKSLRDPEEASEFLTIHAKVLRSQDHHSRAEELLWEGKTDLVDPLLQNFTPSQTKIFKARIAYLKNDTAALKGLDPKTLSDEGVWFDYIKWHRRFDEDSGIEAYNEAKPFIKTHLSRWNKEKHIIVRDGMRAKKYKAAYELVSEHEFKSGSDFAEAEWLSGFIAHRFLNENQKALKHFDRLLETLRQPMDIAQSAYWAAQCSKSPEFKKTHLMKASVHPMTYYGQLACKELGLKGYLKLSKRESLKTLSHKFVQLIGALKAAGAKDEGFPFLYLMMKRSGNSEDKLAVIDLANKYAPTTVLDLLDDLEKEGNLMLHQSYPTLQDVAWDAETDKALAHAIIRKESKFKASDVSHAGAIGLMQINPLTGAQIAKRIKIPSYTSEKLKDPKVNIRIGQSYIAKLLKRYEGDTLLMLAAYNTGPGVLERKWLPKIEKPGEAEIDRLAWIELIPYPETRYYLLKVLAAHNIYGSQS